MACSEPNPQAFEMILNGVDRIVAVDDAAVAGAMADKERNTAQMPSLPLTGGNVDTELFAAILAGDDRVWRSYARNSH